MNYRPDWDDQFREDGWERAARWRRIKAERRAAGKCWQCAKPVEACACPNVTHRDNGSDPVGLRREAAQGEASQSGPNEDSGIAQPIPCSNGNPHCKARQQP